MSGASKKLYIAVALLIREAKREHPDDKVGILALQRKLRDYFRSDNPKFDSDKFNDACRVEE